MSRGFEWIVDDSGWAFLMPRLTSDDVDRLGLGTMDLADFTFGTANAILFLYKPKEYFSLLERVLWRIENILRLLQWWFVLENHKVLGNFFALLRHIVFELAWKVSTIGR